jgi:hypothetical protein
MFFMLDKHIYMYVYIVFPSIVIVCSTIVSYMLNHMRTHSCTHVYMSMAFAEKPYVEYNQIEKYRQTCACVCVCVHIHTYMHIHI